ncbi:MAG: helix-turn-helix transcriptional regulator [Candidatus Omnitrophota bacterium]
MKLERVDEHLKEKLKDPYFRELYDLEEQKLKIVKHIIDYRIKKDLSQKDLADKIGVTQQHISKIENGEFSSMTTLEKVLLSIGYTVKIQATPLQAGIRRRIEQIIHPSKMEQDGDVSKRDRPQVLTGSKNVSGFSPPEADRRIKRGMTNANLDSNKQKELSKITAKQELLKCGYWPR